MPPLTAAEYMKHWGGRKVWQHLDMPRHQDRLRECARLATGKTAADIGCAYGHSTEIMARLRPEITWTGIDFAEDAIRNANQFFGHTPVEFECVEKSLDLGIAQYDSVVCSEVIEHIENDAEFIVDVAMCASKRAIFTTPARAIQDPGHLRLYTEDTLRLAFGDLNPDIYRFGIFWIAIVEIS